MRVTPSAYMTDTSAAAWPEGMDSFQAARAAYASGAWIDVLRLASTVLAVDPLHLEAAELVVAAQHALDAVDRTRGERRLMTVLFCDLVDSTALVSELGPELYREMTLEVHDLCVRVVTEHEGCIAQFLGDGVLAYFCYPQAHEDDARRAILAALCIASEIQARGAEFEARFGRGVACRIGIDTGILVVGALGSGQWKTTDSVVGDAVNIAARLQNAARPNELIITDSTFQLVKRFFVVGSPEVLHLRNLRRPVHAYRVIGTTDALEKPETISRRRAPLVGRTREAAVVTDAWSAVLAGRGRQLLVLGDAGIGKSRLVEHVVNLVNASGGRHVELRCSGVHAHSAFRPVSMALRRLLGLEDLDTATGPQRLAQRLAALAPEEIVSEETVDLLARLLGLPVDLDLLPQQIRVRTMRAFNSVVRGMARSAPLLVVVDDIHDADASSVELVGALANDVGVPFLLLVTSRRPVHGLAFSDPDLVLEPLSPKDTETLVRSLIADDDPDLVASVATRSDGVPLFAEELALAVGEGSASGYNLPLGLSMMFTGRFDELDRRTRNVADAVAVLGDECAEDLLRELVDVPGEVLAASLESLVRRRLVVRSGPAAREVRFRHAVVRDAAYGRQLTAGRQRLHRRAAAALERRSQAGRVVAPEIVAEHLQEAGERADAFQWWQRAGATAAGIGAYIEAMSHYRKALGLIDVLDERQARENAEFSLQMQLGISTSAAEGYTSERALAAYGRAEELGTTANTPEMLPATWGLWAFHVVRGDHATSSRLIERAVRIGEVSGDDQAMAFARAIRGYQQFYLGSLEAAERDLIAGCAADSLPEMPHDPAVASRALLAIVRCIRGETEQARVDNASAIAAARALTDRRAAFTQAYALAYSAKFHQFSGDAGTAAADAAATIAIAADNNFPTWQLAGAIHQAIANCSLGDRREWAAVLEERVDIWRKQGGAELLVPYFLGRLGAARLEAGQVDEALAANAEALSLAYTSGERFYEPELHRFRAAGLRKAGAAAAEVVSSLETAISMGKAHGSRLFQLRALLDLRSFEVSGGPPLASIPRLTGLVEHWPAGQQPSELRLAIALLTT